MWQLKAPRIWGQHCSSTNNWETCTHRLNSILTHTVGAMFINSPMEYNATICHILYIFKTDDVPPPTPCPALKCGPKSSAALSATGIRYMSEPLSPASGNAFCKAVTCESRPGFPQRIIRCMPWEVSKAAICFSESPPKPHNIKLHPKSVTFACGGNASGGAWSVYMASSLADFPNKLCLQATNFLVEKKPTNELPQNPHPKDCQGEIENHRPKIIGWFVIPQSIINRVYHGIP